MFLPLRLPTSVLGTLAARSAPLGRPRSFASSSSHPLDPRAMSTLKKLVGMLRRVRWFNLAILTVTPAVGLYGTRTTALQTQTLLWSIAYYVISMLGKCVPLGFVRCPP